MNQANYQQKIGLVQPRKILDTTKEKLNYADPRKYNQWLKDVNHMASLEKASNVFNKQIITDKTDKMYIIPKLFIDRITTIQAEEYKIILHNRATIDLEAESEEAKRDRIIAEGITKITDADLRTLYLQQKFIKDFDDMADGINEKCSMVIAKVIKPLCGENALNVIQEIENQFLKPSDQFEHRNKLMAIMDAIKIHFQGNTEEVERELDEEFRSIGYASVITGTTGSLECLISNFNYIINERANLKLSTLTDKFLLTELRARMYTNNTLQTHLIYKFFSDFEETIKKTSEFKNIFVLFKEAQGNLEFKHVFDNQESTTGAMNSGSSNTENGSANIFRYNQFSYAGVATESNNTCYAFQKGTCTRGDNCRYSHTLDKKRKICDRYNMAAGCVNPNCRYIHELQDKDKGICPYFKRNKHCRFGDQCYMKHDSSQTSYQSPQRNQSPGSRFNSSNNNNSSIIPSMRDQSNTFSR